MRSHALLPVSSSAFRCLPSPELRAASGDSRVGLAVGPAGIARPHALAPYGVVTSCGVVASCAPARHSLLRPRVSSRGCCCAWYARSLLYRPRARSASLRAGGGARAQRAALRARCVPSVHSPYLRHCGSLTALLRGIAVCTFALRPRASCALCALRLSLACVRGALLALTAPLAALDSCAACWLVRR